MVPPLPGCSLQPGSSSRWGHGCPMAEGSGCSSPARGDCDGRKEKLEGGERRREGRGWWRAPGSRAWPEEGEGWGGGVPRQPPPRCSPPRPQRGQHCPNKAIGSQELLPKITPWPGPHFGALLWRRREIQPPRSSLPTSGQAASRGWESKCLPKIAAGKGRLVPHVIPWRWQREDKEQKPRGFQSHLSYLGDSVQARPRADGIPLTAHKAPSSCSTGWQRAAAGSAHLCGMGCLWAKLSQPSAGCMFASQKMH